MGNTVDDDEEEEQADEIRELAVPANGTGKRIDAWVAGQLPDLSRTRIQAFIREGRVTLDGATVKPYLRTSTAGTVVVRIPPAAPAIPQPQDIPLDIVFEDADVIVLNKPAGLVVHPAPGHPDGTLVNALLFHCKGGLRGVGGVERPGIVHRLDKDTSGLMVAAKTEAGMDGLRKLFAEGGIHKEYLAWVHGAPPQKEGMEETLIGRHPFLRQRMAVVERNGKRAVTYWAVEERRGPITLVRCRIETGRTHQIRVHMQHLGCPVAGDAVYGKPELDRQMQPPPPRQLLHSERLTFTHPVTGAAMAFNAPLPPDFLPYF
jgi:23S rRNA pseudouridine1911/1915/1917 synthase